MSTRLRREDGRQTPACFHVQGGSAGCGCGLFRADPQTGAGTKPCAETESNLTQDHTGAASSWPWAWELMSGCALGDGYFSSLSAARDGEDRGIVSGRAGIVSWLSCLPRLQIFLTSQHL